MLREITTIQRNAGDLSEKIAEFVSTRKSQARAAEQIRRRFVAEGGDAALKRARIEAEQHEMQKNRAAIEHELRELANGLLPFAVAPKVVKAFQKALSRKSGGKGRKEAVKQFRKLSGLGVEADRETEGRTGMQSIGLIWRASSTAGLRATIPTQGRRAYKEVGDGTAALARLAGTRSGGKAARCTIGGRA